jgi:Glutathione synthase/Ribosomal protein S6 modification enzyme (glutaminyl transferase)
MGYKSSSIKSKWVKTKWLLGSSTLRHYVPWTLPFTRGNLDKMVARHSTVYFKPTGGTGGSNIVRIKRQGNRYTTKHRRTIREHSGIEGLFGFLKARGSEPYLLQKGIKLASVKGRPFDIRVMVQKTGGVWTSTAIFLKIGKAGSVATNYSQGGKIGFLRQTLREAGYEEESIKRIRKDLEQLGVNVGQQFDKHYKGFRELGLDVALDNQGRLWILEVNTRPQFYPLKNMGDRRMYRKIISYAKQYGRTK